MVLTHFRGNNYKPQKKPPAATQPAQIPKMTQPSSVLSASAASGSIPQPVVASAPAPSPDKHRRFTPPKVYDNLAEAPKVSSVGPPKDLNASWRKR